MCVCRESGTDIRVCLSRNVEDDVEVLDWLKGECGGGRDFQTLTTLKSRLL